MLYREFELFTEQKEHGIMVWVAILDGKTRREHPEALTAIINTGVCDDRGTASLIAKDQGYDFQP